jgi:Flp pilus assembly protein TadD
LGEFSKAETIYRGAVEKFPGNVVARNGLADVFAKQKKFREAEAIYRKTMELFPDDVFARNGLADVFAKQGRFDEAAAIYSGTLKDERFHGNVVARNGLADIFTKQRRFSNAEAIYRKTMGLFPDNAVARNGLADVFDKQGEFRNAEDIYRGTIRLFSDDVFARNGLADVVAKQGRLAEALEIIDQVVGHQGIKPYDIIATFIKVKILLKMEREPRKCSLLLIEALKQNDYSMIALRQLRIGFRGLPVSGKTLEIFDNLVAYRGSFSREQFEKSVDMLLNNPEIFREVKDPSPPHPARKPNPRSIPSQAPGEPATINAKEVLERISGVMINSDQGGFVSKLRAALEQLVQLEATQIRAVHERPQLNRILSLLASPPISSGRFKELNAAGLMKRAREKLIEALII